MQAKPAIAVMERFSEKIVKPSVLRILLIDDNSDENESLATLLAQCGQEVRTALDGPTVLEIATEFRPQVVICDLGLPGMDGYQVLRQLREQSGEAMPISFALTGNGRDEDRKTSREAGFDGHLVKPIDFEGLQAMIATQFRTRPADLKASEALQHFEPL